MIPNLISLVVSSRSKLWAKLKSRNIKADELRTLLKMEGFELDHQKGSHQFWKRATQRYVLATHGKDLKLYQIKQAMEVLDGHSNEKK